MSNVSILVVDDSPDNLALAKSQFQGKDVILTLCPIFSLAKELIINKKYDILLTDLMMPGESKGVSNTNPEIGKDVPYGLVLAILAKNNGIENVAILTNINHHSGPIAWAMDSLLAKNQFISCYNSKDWLTVAEEFISIGNSPAKSSLDAAGSQRKSVMVLGGSDNYVQSLKEKLSETLDFVIIPKDKVHLALRLTIEYIPDYILLFGEIDPRAAEASDYAVELFTDLKKLIPANKIIVSGWCVSEDSCYLRLPFSLDDLMKRLTSD